MKKLMFAACTLLAAGMLFSSCSKKAENGSASAKSGKKVTLTVWESRNGPDEFIKQAGEAYTAKNPNVEIKYVNVELGDAVNQVTLDGRGIGPDLFAAPHDRLGSLVSAGLVNPTVNADEIKKNVLGACSTALTYDETMYGYPVSAETYALFYNKDLISENEVPKTWDELIAWAKAFNKANPGKYGFVMDVSNGYYTIVFTTADGNRLFGPDGTDTTNTNINSEDSIKGMQLLQRLRKEVFDVPAADINTSTADAAFQSGTAAMHITGLWNVVPFEDAGINFGVTTLPSLPGDDTPAASFSGTRAMFVSAYSKNPDEAADFAQFLLTPEMQKLRFDLTGTVPSISVEVSSPYLAGFMNQLDYAFPMPSIPEMASYWDAMNNASKNIWDGKDVKIELDACNAAILGK